MSPLPRSLREYKGHNLVDFGGRIYCIPFGVAVDWSGAEPKAAVSLAWFSVVEDAVAGLDARVAALPPAEPVQWGEFLQFNIVKYGEAFVAIPFALEVDWTIPAALRHPDILISPSEADLRAMLEHKAAQQRPRVKLIEAYRGHNILLVNDAYIAAAHGVEVIWSENTWRYDPRLLRGADLADLRRRIARNDKVSRNRLRLSENNAHFYAMSDFLSHEQPLDELGLPEIIEIEPIHTCNLRCIMCHVSYEKLSKQRLDIRRTLRALRGVNDRWVMLASSYEPAAHPEFARLASGLSDQGFNLDMTTNGSLFTASLLAGIKDANFRFVTVSFDGATKATFEHIRRRANFELTIERIAALRQTFAARGTYFNVNNTVMRSNLTEVEAAVDLWESHDFDHLGLILMRQRDPDPTLKAETLGDDMAEVHQHFSAAARRVIEREYRLVLSSPAFLDSPLRADYPEAFTDGVVHSRHPRYRLPINPRDYYQRGYYPGMPVDCRSPFKFARINYNGDVVLCQRFIVGNIYLNTFLEIWHGQKARAVREGIRRPGNEKTCHSCSYYRFCVKAGMLETSDPANFINLSNPAKLSPDEQKQDDGTPIFLGLQYNYRKFFWSGEYFGILDYPLYGVRDLGAAEDLMLGRQLLSPDLIRTASRAELEEEVERRRARDPERVRHYPGGGIPFDSLRRFLIRRNPHIQR